MKIHGFLMALIVLCTQTVISQVGIGTTNPNAVLDISSSNQAVPSNMDGILIPKVDEFPITSPTVLQDGMLVFVTGNGIVTKGFYYWDNTTTSWISVTGAKRINDLVDGKSDANGASIFLGIDSGLNDDQSSNGNVGIGFWSMVNNTTGELNTAVGFSSLYSNIDGIANTAFGSESLFSNTNGTTNTAVGYLSLYNNLSGVANTAIGAGSLTSNSDGEYNTALGVSSLAFNSSGLNNTAMGTASLGLNETGNYNVALGYGSLPNNVNGNDNTAIGNLSGLGDRGNNNVFIGSESAGSNVSDSKSGSVFVGYQSGFNETASDRLYIENSNADANNALIYGEFDNDILAFNANVGIGTITPGSRLHIAEEGTSGVQTIVAGIASDSSNRPVLQFSETATIGLTEGMSLEYNGTGSAGANRMVVNGIGGNPLFQLRNDGNFNVLDGRVGVQTPFPTCAMEINHPSGSGTEGLKLSNQVDTDNWRFYLQWNSNTLALFYNDVNVGNFDDVSGAYTAISDRNFKTNIREFSSVLDKVNALKVVDYNFKAQQDSKKYVGLIAQDVEAIFPHLVNPPNEESENYTMDYSGFGVIAIKAIQEQQKTIGKQQTDIDSLKNELEELKELIIKRN